MRVSLVSANGPWLEAVIATPYGELTVMDGFSISESAAPSIGSEFDAELSATVDEDEAAHLQSGGAHADAPGSGADRKGENPQTTPTSRSEPSQSLVI